MGNCKEYKCDARSSSSSSLKFTYSTLCFKNVCKRLRSNKNFIFRYQTPWKRIRHRRDTKKGYESLMHFSFNCNKTLPCSGQKSSKNISFKSFHLSQQIMDNISVVDELTGMPLCTKSNQSRYAHGSNNTIDPDTLLINDLIQVSQQNINPYKAIFIIDPEFANIFNVNRNACTLLSYKPKDFRRRSLFHLMKKVSSNPLSALAEGYLNKESGSMVLLSGKVVEFIQSNGTVISTSLWIHQYDQNGPSVAFVEPVQKINGQLILNRCGNIVSVDSEAPLIFQCTSDELHGVNIKHIIPSLILPEPKDLVSSISYCKKLKTNGSTLDGSIVPLSLSIKYQENKDFTESDDTDDKQFIIDITVYINISGLIIINEEGVIECICHHFIMFLFGYTQNKIIGKKITQLLPNFCEDFECDDICHSRNYTISHLLSTDVNLESFLSFPSRKNIVSESNKNLIANSPDTILPDSRAMKLQSNDDVKDKLYFDEFQEKENSFAQEIVNSKSKLLNMEGNDCLKLSIRDTKSSEDLPTPINDAINKISENIENDLNISNISKKLNKKDLETSSKPYLHLDIVSFEDDDELPTPINEAESQEQKDLTESRKDLDVIFATPQKQKCRNILLNSELLTSTPVINERNCDTQLFREGKYKGIGKHEDGRSIDVSYAVSKESISQNKNVFCVWITFEFSNNTNQDTCTVTSSNNSTVEHSLGQIIKLKAAKNKSCTNSVSFASQCEEEQTKGEYNQNYTTLCQIGKGAFGCVKMAYRKSDKLLVVSKFILKDRVNDEFWIWDKANEKKVPLEISLLPTLTHPNIVSVYDVFENDLYFQLIMEKHGSGMDLFEFIDRVPKLDEPLISYIYRQIASAVEYLHSLHILHRDIKDENIIINHKFEVKLIDFGSATFFNENSVFSTFYGTTEYCSPEVLAGNKYFGPELEMWSMGVTLYVLTYSINPFEDAEETLNGKLKLPHKVTTDLEQLLVSLLCKDPIKRCTLPQLLSSKWLFQPIDISKYDFAQVVQCDPREANPDLYYSADAMSGFVTPQDTIPLSDTNTVPTSFSHNDYAKLQIDSGENTEYYNDDYDESWDDDSFS